jgi:hypothetical protein
MLPLYVVFYLVAGLHFVNIYGTMPPAIPVHFNQYGEPDGWRSSKEFAQLHWLFIFLMSGIFAVLAIAVKKLPSRYIFIPHREYWLAPERRQETIERIVDALTWCGIAAGGFVIAVNHLIVKAAIKGARSADLASVKTVALWAFGLIAFIILRLMLKLRQPPPDMK